MSGKQSSPADICIENFKIFENKDLKSVFVVFSTNNLAAENLRKVEIFNNKSQPKLTCSQKYPKNNNVVRVLIKTAEVNACFHLSSL